MSIVDKDALFATMSSFCVAYQMALNLNYYEIDAYKGEQYWEYIDGNEVSTHDWLHILPNLSYI